MIVDPFDHKQGITATGNQAAQVYLLPTCASPIGDLSDAAFIGLAEIAIGDGPDRAGSNTRPDYRDEGRP